jgi:hypothetical protein
MAAMEVPIRIHVDRHAELERFGNMLDATVRTHILLIRAGPGMGKSSLLAEFRKRAADRPMAFVNLRQPYAPAEILDEMVSQLGRARFAGYAAAQGRGPTIGSVNVTGNTMTDSRIGVTVSSSEADRRSLLTRHFFEDLTDRDEPALLILDTYEATSDEVKTWVSGMFLGRVRGNPNVLLVIAGREVPEVDIDFEEWSLRYDMQPWDRASIAEYAAFKGLVLSDEGLDVLVVATQGLPLSVATVVDSLLRRREPGT